MGTAPRSVEDALADAGVRFLLDENIPTAFAAALRLVEYNVVSNKEVNLVGKPDPEVITFCADKRVVWMTRDQDARKKVAYAGLVRDKAVSAVFLAHAQAKHSTMKEQFEVIVKHMRGLEDRYDRAKGPRYFVCRARGLPIEVKHFADRPGH